jgi:hypothetical protein
VRNKKAEKIRKAADRVKRKKVVEYVVIVGKKVRVKYPEDIVNRLADRFIIDSKSRTGLRWTESDINKCNLRGREAGYLRTHGYFFVNVVIHSVSYSLQVANIVWMLANGKIVKDSEVIDHDNNNRLDNRIENLISIPSYLNNINKKKCTKSASSYKNVIISTRPNFRAAFKYMGKRWCTKSVPSQHYAFILGWQLLTSGEVPLEYIKAQSLEYLEGTYLKRALAECAKEGIVVKRPKYKTLHEYIASVEAL